MTSQLAMQALIDTAALERAITDLVQEYCQTIEYAATLSDPRTTRYQATAALREQAVQESYAAGIRQALTVISERTGIQ